MNLFIEENGSKDKEVTILDTRLPYFYAKVKELFPNEPEEVRVVIVRNEDEFNRLKEEEEECRCAFVDGNAIYIYEPSLMETATEIEREHFYEILCQELVYLFYQRNKISS
jgi:hypothetical protein